MLAGCGKESQVQVPTTEGDNTTEAEEVVELEEDTGTVFRIFCWDSELKEIFENYYPGYVADEEDENKGKIRDITVDWQVVDLEDGEYEKALREALEKNEEAEPEEKVDLFLIHSDMAYGYVNDDGVLTLEQMGITVEDTADQYAFSREIVTDQEGNQRGSAIVLSTGAFVYKRSIAKEVFGTDDPEEVQIYLSSWENLKETGAQLKDAGYLLVASADETYGAYLYNGSDSWVDENSNIVVSQEYLDWAEFVKTCMENGYIGTCTAGDRQWKKEVQADGKAFGFFYNEGYFTDLEQDAEAAFYEEYAICQGPAAYYNQTAFLCGAVGTDNPNLTADVIRMLSCDSDIMKAISEERHVLTNNMTAMNEIAYSEIEAQYLGGQNYIGVLADSASKLHAREIGQYDAGCDELFFAAMEKYWLGETTFVECLTAYYQAVTETYPQVSIVKEEENEE